MSPVEIPFRYNQGSADDTRGDFRIYGGTMFELNLIPDPERSRTLGTLTAIGPAAVSTSRSGK
ncbi:hypothetical protein FEMY_24960 [Ferrovum myxofaciens]|uniref:Uncharacterized protein n=1 Tax=Ferrovum myxofaciens TaxID=416213 RepID=A0A149VUX1_9PROT|nr:hypothetical protein FEMY_24960 [Ferrovum myxofaciens]